MRSPLPIAIVAALSLVSTSQLPGQTPAPTPGGVGIDPQNWQASEVLEGAREFLEQITTHINASAPGIVRATHELSSAYEAYQKAPNDPAARRKLLEGASAGFEFTAKAFEDALAHEHTIEVEFQSFHHRVAADEAAIHSDRESAGQRLREAESELTKLEQLKATLQRKNRDDPANWPALDDAIKRLRTARRTREASNATLMSLGARARMIDIERKNLRRAQLVLVDQFQDLRDDASRLGVLSKRLEGVIVNDEIERSLASLTALSEAIESMKPDGKFDRMMTSAIECLEHAPSIDNTAPTATTSLDRWLNTPSSKQPSDTRVATPGDSR